MITIREGNNEEWTFTELDEDGKIIRSKHCSLELKHDNLINKKIWLIEFESAKEF